MRGRNWDGTLRVFKLPPRGRRRVCALLARVRVWVLSSSLLSGHNPTFFINCLHTRRAAKMKVGVKGLTVKTKVSYDGHSLGKDDPTVVLEGVFFAVSLEIDPKSLDLSVKGHVYSHTKARVLPGYNSGWGKANGEILKFLGEDGASASALPLNAKPHCHIINAKPHCH